MLRVSGTVLSKTNGRLKRKLECIANNKPYLRQLSRTSFRIPPASELSHLGVDLRAVEQCNSTVQGTGLMRVRVLHVRFNTGHG